MCSFRTPDAQPRLWAKGRLKNHRPRALVGIFWYSESRRSKMFSNMTVPESLEACKYNALQSRRLMSAAAFAEFSAKVGLATSEDQVSQLVWSTFEGQALDFQMDDQGATLSLFDAYNQLHFTREQITSWMNGNSNFSRYTMRPGRGLEFQRTCGVLTNWWLLSVRIQSFSVGQTGPHYVIELVKDQLRNYCVLVWQNGVKQTRDQEIAVWKQCMDPLTLHTVQDPESFATTSLADREGNCATDTVSFFSLHYGSEGPDAYGSYRLGWSFTNGRSGRVVPSFGKGSAVQFDHDFLVSYTFTCTCTCTCTYTYTYTYTCT